MVRHVLTRWIAALALGAGGLVVAGTSTAHAGGPVRYQAEEARLVHATARDDRAGFDGTGFADYDRAAGGYVEFTVTAPTAGWAMLRIRYANGSRHERYLSVGINGEVHPTPVAFSPTGSWNTWQEYPVTPLLSAGVNKIRLIADGSGGGPNLDWMEVEITAETVDYQAEDAAISGGVVQSEHAGFTGRGYVNTTNAVGASVTWTVDAAVRAFGTLDILVNNVGGSGGAGAFDAATVAQWASVMDRNLMSAVWCSQRAVEVMRNQGGGCIIHINSIYGLEYATSAPYTTAKAGLTALTKEMAVDLARHRIRVNGVAPIARPVLSATSPVPARRPQERIDAPGGSVLRHLGGTCCGAGCGGGRCCRTSPAWRAGPCCSASC